MTNAETRALIFKDRAGEYYVLPQEALERGRVPAEHKTEVERALAAGVDGGDDVEGFLLVGLAIVAAGFALGFTATSMAIEAGEGSGEGGTMTNAQWVEQITGRPFPQ